MAKRRANGEGNIRKRKDGRWEGRYTAGYDQDGKRIIKNVLGRTRAEVKSKLSVAIAESQQLDVSRSAPSPTSALPQQATTAGPWRNTPSPGSEAPS